MAALRWLAAGLALVLPQPGEAGDLGRWQGLIGDASRQFGVPAAWIERVMDAESAGATELHGKPITSAAGAMGLMQLMPGTWAQMRRQLRLQAGPYDPRANILAGTAYLRAMFDRFGYPGLFGAYNAGPLRYAKYLSGQQPLPGETLAYLAKTTATSVASAAATPRRRTRPETLFFASGGTTSFASVSGGADLFAIRESDRGK